MNNNSPLVSIVIPVYNGSNYMCEAIDSALAQDYENKEIIVVNDGSDDNGKTEEIALSYGDKIKYICKENGGVSSALNVGIKNMKGKYFSWLSHDDLYLPNKISMQIDALNKYNEKKVICICRSKQIDENSQDLLCGNSEQYLNCDNEDGLIDWKQALQLLISHGSFGGCNFLIPKAALINCGGFNEEMRYTQDFYMWIKLFLDGWNLVVIPEVLVGSRVHSRQVTVTGKDLFHKDCDMMGDLLQGELMAASNQKYNYIKLFALYCAKYNNISIANKYVRFGKQHNIISLLDIFHIKIIMTYGCFRPYLRIIVYKILKYIMLFKHEN